MTEQDFFEKKNDVKKEQKTRVFGLFKEYEVITLSGFNVKQNFLWSFNILWKLHAWEKSGSQVMVKTGSCKWDFSIL